MIFSFYSQTCVKQAPKEKAKKWLIKTSACLIQVNLHKFSNNWLLNTGVCLIQVVSKIGLTVSLN